MKALITTLIVFFFVHPSQGQNLANSMLGYKADLSRDHRSSDPYINRIQQLELRVQKFEREKNFKELAYTWYVLGTHHKRYGKYESALACFQKGLILSKRMRSSAQEAQMRMHIGSALNNLDRHREALDHFLGALTIAKRSRLEAIKDPLYQHLSFTYSALAQHEKAYEYRQMLARR